MSVTPEVQVPDLSAPPPAFVLAGARVPACLLVGPHAADGEGLAQVDILLTHGGIAAIMPAGTARPEPRLELSGRVVMPGLIDAHTHLDKAFTWPRAPNRDGTFEGAIAACDTDIATRWTPEDLHRRMSFALRCAHAHGTVAIRTHLDSGDRLNARSWPVFAQLRAEWADRIALQAVSLVPVELARDPAALSHVVETVKSCGGVLGAYTYRSPHLSAGIERLFEAAERHGLDLDFHADETGDPKAGALAIIAQTAIRRRFEGRILVGHCCSLARQDETTIGRTLDMVARARIAVVSLPQCNLYLQDRVPGRTPLWRGVTLLHEMKARGIPVMVASDNARDAFHAYGDLDLVEVWREAVRILHLDHPHGDWPSIVARTPADLLGYNSLGLVAPGRRADLVIFRARSLNELLARPQADRIVLRGGVAIDTTPPDPAELDDLMEPATL